MRYSYLIVLTLFGLGYASTAQIIHIPENQPSIQAGINAANAGDTILIEEGCYFENIDFRGKAITVASKYLIDGDTSHISKTIINGSKPSKADAASVVSLRSGEDTSSVLCGLTITRGTGSFVSKIHTIRPKYKYIAGGGIIIYNSGGKIIHNIIEENHLVASDSVRGNLGCGILAAVNNNHSVIIRNNIIRSNSGTNRGGWGGGVCLLGGRFIVEHNSIVGNSFKTMGLTYGAGIWFENESQEGTIPEACIRYNIVSGNSVNTSSSEISGGGGGIALSMGYDTERVQVHNNIICNNYVTGIGGAMYFWSNKSIVYNNIIFDNVSTMKSDPIVFESGFDEIDTGNDVIEKNNLSWSGNIWILTNLGLVKLHSGPGHMESLKSFDGKQFTPNESGFNINPLTGELLIGETEGRITFFSNKILGTAFVPPSIIVDFVNFDAPVYDSDITGQVFEETIHNRLDLPLKENFFQIHFSLLTHSHIGGKFKYFMDGVDKDTSIVGFTGSAVYQNLKPGQYRFWVTKEARPGVWNSEGIMLDIRIHAPWYRSNLAFVSYFLLLLFLVIGAVRFRTARLRREKVQLEMEVAKRTVELNLKNEQIREMERLRTRFFTDVSHEIRTPLSLITGPLDNLIRQDHRDPKTISWLSMIRRNSQRLLQLVNQLLDISRLDAGQMKLVLEEFDVIKHIRILTSEYSSLAESRNVRFIVDVPDVELITCYDREKVEKIATNLLSNAFKFTPEHGTVTCRIKILSGHQEPSSQKLRIIVADTGPGIPIDEREKIFERFYRAEGDLTEDAGGTGVGLSLTRELINLMHGDVAVKSIEGKGSIFIVSIPLGKEHLSENEYLLRKADEQKPDEELVKKEAEIPPKGREIPDQSVEVLVIEDNEDLRSFIRENLSGIYTILEAKDGSDGLDQARSRIPDLIISDVMMPGMDGMELCDKVKNDELTSHIPVILLTAKSTSKDKIEGLKLGADDYIFKPFSTEELKVRIANLLEQRERLRKKYSGMIGLDWGEMSVTTLDEKFLKKLSSVISANLADFDFDVRSLQEKMSLSHAHLFRKTKALTGDSPGSLIREMRLKTAATFIERGDDSITEISMSVGFSNPSYFAQCFKEYYGKTPMEFKRGAN